MTYKPAEVCMLVAAFLSDDTVTSIRRGRSVEGHRVKTRCRTRAGLVGPAATAVRPVALAVRALKSAGYQSRAGHGSRNEFVVFTGAKRSTACEADRHNASSYAWSRCSADNSSRGGPRVLL